MAISTAIIKGANKIFPKVVHPFNLANAGEKTYAEWQYEKGADTLKCYADKYKPSFMFEGKKVLDVGCGAAGKSMYYLKLGAARVTGVDIVQSYEREAMQLAAKLGYSRSFNFICASAEQLPFPDNTFDTIILNDTMEHVSEPQKVLEEMLRLVHPDGHIYINFPPYGHPFGAHMSDAINIPWVHFLFSERALIRAYRELTADLPDGKERVNLRVSADRYGREYISYINRMTVARFGRILKEMRIKPQYYREVPLRGIFTPLTKIGFVKEAFVKMVVCVIIKSDTAPNPDNRAKRR
ncbi:MAG: class I SAM-dependent methyltransferase [Eubacteriales bacterium]|nr:class I SAM-dependent methyltransferase [Eubacteriales bacterium]